MTNNYPKMLLITGKTPEAADYTLAHYLLPNWDHAAILILAGINRLSSYKLCDLLALDQ